MFIAQSYKIVNLVLFPPFLQNFSGEVTSVNRIPTAAAIFGTKSIERYKYFSPISSDSSRILYEDLYQKISKLHHQLSRIL